MKTAIVYYSLLGNVGFVADKIANNIDCDVIKLETVKSYPKSKGKLIFMGGMKSVFKSKPKLKEYDFDADKYDQIVIGTPTWAGTFAPAIRTFLRNNKDSIKDKKISVFVSCSGGEAESVLQKIKQYVGLDDLNASVVLTDPKNKPSEENDGLINGFINKIK